MKHNVIKLEKMLNDTVYMTLETFGKKDETINHKKKNIVLEDIDINNYEEKDLFFLINKSVLRHIDNENLQGINYKGISIEGSSQGSYQIILRLQ